MSRLLYFDCFSGISGDMTLGALLDAGLPLEELKGALGSLAVSGFDISTRRVLRAGVSATQFIVHAHGHTHDAPRTSHRHDHPHDHDHSHGHDHVHDHGHSHSDEHPHRSLPEIFTLIDKSALSPAGRNRAQQLFQRLAEVEAAIHQMPIDRVYLHEVGALDSIIDIVGAVFALEWFGAERMMASALNVGGGMVDTAHGHFPVPAPATVKLLGDAPIYGGTVQKELVTPTGALIVSSYASSFGPVPPMTVERVGYGAGSHDFPSTPNVLRVLVGQSMAVAQDPSSGGAGSGVASSGVASSGVASSDVAQDFSPALGGRPPGDRVTVIECEIDDMNPQIFGVVMDRLYAAGALEVFYVSVQMKKNRPGTLLTVVAPPERRSTMADIVFRETTTIGLRHYEVDRECLQREIVSVETPIGAVRFKVAWRDGHIVNAVPEFEDCARLASANHLSVKEVQALAVKAYRP